MRAGRNWNSRLRLEDCLQCELELPGIECIRDRAKVTGTYVRADAAIIGVTFELRVIPGIEAVRAELHVEALGDGEVLEQREIPVVTAGTAQCIETKITVGPKRWCGKGRRVEPRAYSLRIRDRPVYLWPVPGVGNNAGSVVSAYPQIQRSARFHSDNPGQRPSTQSRSHKAVAAVLQERDIVDEINESDLSTIKLRRAVVVAPSHVRVRRVIEVATTAVAGGCIHRLRNRVADLELQIFSYVSVQVDLQRVVM